MMEDEQDAVASSGCISLMNPGQSIRNWYQCLDLTCMEQPNEEAPQPMCDAARSEVFAERAEEEERKGNYRAASECYRKAVRLDPQNARLHNNYGYLCSTHTHDYATAEYHYRQAIQCDPDYALSHNNLAFFLKKNKRDLDGAEKHYREAIRCDPRYAFAHSNLGVLLKSKRDFIGAEKHYLAAIDSNPRYAPAYLNYSLLLKNHDEASSWDYLLKAMDIDPALRESQAAQNLVRAFGKAPSDLHAQSGQLNLDHYPRLAALLGGGGAPRDDHPVPGPRDARP